MEAVRRVTRHGTRRGATPGAPLAHPAASAAAPDVIRLTEEALMGLCDAYRQDGEAHSECLQRLGAERYAALLREVGRADG